MSSPAQILVQYFLSETGRTAALLAGINAGETQVIVLRSPDYVDPPTSTDALQAVSDAASATAVAAVGADKTPDLAEAAKALLAGITALVSVLDPGTNRNVTVERASPELWALAVSLAFIDSQGNSSIGVRTDDGRYPGYTTGFSVSWDEHKSAARVLQDKSYAQYDSIQTAASLLPAERDRRAALLVLAKATDEEAEALAVTKRAEREASNRAYAHTRAVTFLEQESAFNYLPEVAFVRSLVDADDDRIYVSANSGKSPLDDAERAIIAEKARLEHEVRAAWIRSFGSDHAKRLLSELGQIADMMYRNERLAVERPGWQYGSPNSYADSQTPTLSELDRLAAAKGIDPDATLKKVSGDRTNGLRPFSSFLGWSIYYTLGSTDSAGQGS